MLPSFLATSLTAFIGGHGTALVGDAGPLRAAPLAQEAPASPWTWRVVPHLFAADIDGSLSVGSAEVDTDVEDGSKEIDLTLEG